MPGSATSCLCDTGQVTSSFSHPLSVLDYKLFLAGTVLQSARTAPCTAGLELSWGLQVLPQCKRHYSDEVPAPPLLVPGASLGVPWAGPPPAQLSWQDGPSVRVCQAILSSIHQDSGCVDKSSCLS